MTWQEIIKGADHLKVYPLIGDECANFFSAKSTKWNGYCPDFFNGPSILSFTIDDMYQSLQKKNIRDISINKLYVFGLVLSLFKDKMLLEKRDNETQNILKSAIEEVVSDDNNSSNTEMFKKMVLDLQATNKKDFSGFDYRHLNFWHC